MDESFDGKNGGRIVRHVIGRWAALRLELVVQGLPIRPRPELRQAPRRVGVFEWNGLQDHGFVLSLGCFWRDGATPLHENSGVERVSTRIDPAEGGLLLFEARILYEGEPPVQEEEVVLRSDILFKRMAEEDV